jgi:hypothetical protein
MLYVKRFQIECRRIENGKRNSRVAGVLGHERVAGYREGSKPVKSNNMEAYP